MKKTITITPAELDKMINEEAEKFKKALLLKKELESVNKQLNEVVAGEEMDAEADGGVHAGQKKPVFTSKPGSPALKMEDEEIDAEVESDEDIDKSTKEEDEKAEVFQAIEDLKASLEQILGKEDESEEKEEEEEGETMEFDVETGEDSEEDSEEKEGEEIDECEMTEDTKEPIEGECAAQVAKEDDVNDNMEKTDHVKEENTLLETEKKRMAFLAGLLKG